MKKIGVIGAGGWGTALANILSENNNHVVLWSFESDVVSEISSSRTNHKYLPEITLNKNLIPTDDFSMLSDSDLFVLAVPTQFIRSVIANNEFASHDRIVVNVAKGIEENTLFRVSEILADMKVINADASMSNYVILTGPSHAEEVARNMPTTVVAASHDLASAQFVQEIFMTEYFRVYSGDDVTGCEIGGSLKNIIAIAAGIIDGLGLGDNTKAALITRGLAEMSRLGVVLGAKTHTFSGLSGLGDLFVTCNSRHSRNRFVGEQIGKGKNIRDITHDMSMIAEGITTTKSAFELARKNKVELPIIEQVYKILFENVPPMKAIKDLMTRVSKQETWW